MPTAFERTIYRTLKPGNPKVTYENVARALAAVKFALMNHIRLDGKVRIPGLGSFQRTTRKARRIRNIGPPTRPDDAENLLCLPETHSVRFSPCGEWRRSLR